MQSGLRWRAVAQPTPLPVRLRALRVAVCTPLWCASTVALVRRCALRFDQWPAASHVVSAPPTLGLAAARHWPARSARPPPRGSLSPRVNWVGRRLRATTLNLTLSHAVSRRSKRETLFFLAVFLAVCFKILVCKPSIHEAYKMMCDPRQPPKFLRSLFEPMAAFPYWVSAKPLIRCQAAQIARCLALLHPGTAPALTSHLLACK